MSEMCQQQTRAGAATIPTIFSLLDDLIGADLQRQRDGRAPAQRNSLLAPTITLTADGACVPGDDLDEIRAPRG